LGHVSPLGHFPIGLLRSHKFNSMVLAMPRNAQMSVMFCRWARF